MRRRQIAAILMSAIMTVSACLPAGGISAFAAENASTGATETTENASAGVTETTENETESKDEAETDDKSEVEETFANETLEEVTHGTETAEDNKDEEITTDEEETENNEEPEQDKEVDMDAETDASEDIDEESEEVQEDASDKTQSAIEETELEDVDELSKESKPSTEHTEQGDVDLTDAEHMDDVIEREESIESTHAADKAVIDSGECGENITWEVKGVDDEFTLYITGFGKMYDSTPKPWNDGWNSYTDNIVNVVISEGITDIGRGAFEDCNGLTSITIPKSVTSIGESAFSYCSSLGNITIPEGVRSIGNYAFADCESLTTITLPQGLTSIGNNVFANCQSLTTISLPEGLTSISDYAFSNCQSLTTISLSEGLTSIGDAAFEGCKSLKSISLPDGVVSIGDSAFSNCSSLISVIIPDGPRSIGDYTFYQCSNLTSISLPESITSIGFGAFIRCNNLAKVSLPDGLTNIGDCVFSGCSSLASITIPEGVVSIGDGAFEECGKLTSIIIPNSVTSIGDSAFGECGELSSVTIPDSLENIGNYIFWNCRNISNIRVSNIDTWLDFPSNTFKDSDYGKYSTPKHLFIGNEEVKSITIPNNVTDIRDHAFDSFSSITDITIPKGVISIGEDAFCNCSSLKSIDIPDSITEIKENAFSYCSSLTSISIPKDVTKIEYGTFDGCGNLSSVNLPNNVTSIGARAFADCQNLTRITIPKGVTSIESNSFAGCSSIKTITIPENVNSINGNAFWGCINLSKIYFYGSAPTKFADDSFQNVEATAYYPVNDETWTESVLSNHGGTITWIPENMDEIAQPNSLKITKGPISLNTGKMVVISAVYYNENCELDEIEDQIHWSVTSEDGGEVSLRRSSESFLGYLCEVSGVKPGTCMITATTDLGLEASVVVNVVPEQIETKETIRIAGNENHLSGSNNYVLDDNSNGSLDFSGPITSEVTISSGSRYSASSITIKKNGSLSVNGTLNASEIHIESGGTLEVLGRVNASSILIDGGNWFTQNGGVLTGYGIVSADYVDFKGYGTCAMDGQLIAKRGFTYNSSKECGEFGGTLFVGGSMNVGKNMKAASNGLTTVIYGDTSGREFVFHKKCNIGNVFALNEESYRKIGIPKNNRVSALQYRNLIQSDTGRWSYSPTTVSLGDDGINDWEQEQGAYYRNLANNQQNVISISFLEDPTERDFVEKLAVAWIGSIEAQVDRGLLTTSKGSYELYFKMNRRDYVLKYEVDGYGNYGNLGVLYFGHADDNDLQYIGVTASASVENFKAGATTYLAESYVQEYYKFATGFLPSWKTEASLKKKLEQMGTKAVIKYFQKNIEKNLFGTLAITKGAEYKQLEKTFSISKMVLNGDVKGLWKYAAKEVTSSVKRKAANSGLDASAEIDEDSNDEGGLPAAKAAVSDEITDEFLRDALLNVLGDDGTGNPDFVKQEDITYLDLSGKYIQSLNGIQKFTNLQTLILSYNEISDLSPISEMTTLRYLYINGQDISDLTPISNLSNLLLLDVGDNNISSIESVAGMTSLRRLVINENPVTSLSGLENCTCLETLEADGISLKDGDLSALNRAEKLKEIHLHGSGIQSIGGINVSSLILLDIGDNEVESLDPIISAAKLESVDASENLISEIPQLINCKALSSLDLSGNALDDLSGLESMPSMQILKLSDCELVSGDIQSLSSIAGLKEIDLSWNTMLDDLSSLSALENLESVDVKMTDMVVLSSPISLGSHEVIVYAEETPNVSVEQEEYIFTGDAVEPSIIIECGDRKVMEDVDYKVSYANNMEPGTATATVEGVGKCLGTLSVDFSIRAANIVSSGTCGDNLNWSLDELGILSITGSGEMYDYPELDVWDDVNYDIKKIVIEDGAESIGKMAFNAFPNLKSISLPSSIREIGDSAFLLCSSLKEIVLPEGVAVIGSHAFDTCSSLESVTIPRSITEIGDDIFNNCRNNIHVTYLGSKEEWNKLGVESIYITVSYAIRSIDDVKVSGVADRIYCGQAIAPKPVVTYEDTALTEGVDYTVSYKNNTNAGMATVTITGIGNYTGTIEKTFEITPKVFIPTIKLSKKEFVYNGKEQKPIITVKNGETELAKTDYTVIWSSGRKNAGIYRVSVKLQGNYQGSNSEIFTIKKATNKITAKNITLGYSAKKRSFALGAKITNGTPKYKSNSKSVTINTKGVVTVSPKFIGKATITITAPEYINYSKTTKKVTVTVRPPRSAFKSVTNSASRQMTLKWITSPLVTGYHIQYSISSKFTKFKSIWITKGSINTSTVKNLTKGKKYYVRIRTIKSVGGVKYYSNWSDVKTLTIRK